MRDDEELYNIEKDGFFLFLKDARVTLMGTMYWKDFQIYEYQYAITVWCDKSNPLSPSPSLNEIQIFMGVYSIIFIIKYFFLSSVPRRSFFITCTDSHLCINTKNSTLYSCCTVTMGSLKL